MHRFDAYTWYLFLINPEYILTSEDGDALDVDEFVNISIVINDDEIWQGWNETDGSMDHDTGNSSTEFLSSLDNITTEANWGLLTFSSTAGDEDEMYEATTTTSSWEGLLDSAVLIAQAFIYLTLILGLVGIVSKAIGKW